MIEETCATCTTTIYLNDDDRWVDIQGEQLCFPALGTDPSAPKHKVEVR